MMTTSIIVAAPDEAPTLNLRGNWQKFKRLGDSWKDASFWWAKQYKLRPKTTKPINIQIEFGTSQPNKRRDPHNWAPTVKAICDGFTNAAVWPDDDFKHVRVLDPMFTADVPDKHVRITLYWHEM